MSDFRKLGIPFLIIFVSALVTKLSSIYLSGFFTPTLFKVLVVVALCLFGASLNASRKKRSYTVWKKVVSILMVIFLLFMQLGLFSFASVAQIFSIFGVDAFYINMLYIFCGYMFVD